MFLMFDIVMYFFFFLFLHSVANKDIDCTGVLLRQTHKFRRGAARRDVRIICN